MANTSTIRFDMSAVRQLLDRLETLEPRIARRFFVKALRAGAGPIQQSARSAVPVGPQFQLSLRGYAYQRPPPGNLRAAIKITQGTDRRTGLHYVEVGPQYKRSAGVVVAPTYAHLVEYGTKPHVIRPRQRNGVLALAGRLIHGSVRHPGARPHPYLRPALEQNRTSAVSRVAESLNQSFAAMDLRAAI